MTTLTGTADAAGTTVSLSGGGFTFNGSVSGSALAGSYTGPNSTAGRFSSLNATSASVTRYCGTYNTTAQSTGPTGMTLTYNESGTFNLEVSSTGTVTGTAATVSPTPACCDALTGTVTGNSITVTSSQGGGGTGTIGGGIVSGSGSVQSGRGTATFSGSTSACP
jgi:hypothetical protein